MNRNWACNPYAIAMLASLVKQVSVETQVVFATQSTLLLDHFRPEDVLVADRVDGGTQLTRLDGAALEDWLQDYSPRPVVGKEPLRWSARS